MDQAKPMSSVVSQKQQRETQHKKIKWKEAMPQVFACSVAQSIVIHAGINMSFTAIMIPQLLDPGSTIKINRDSASWIASMVAVTTPIGSLLAGPMMDWLGRRAACLVSCLPFLAAWVILPFASDVALINISRALAGLGGGLSTAAVVYVSEVADPSLRPSLLSMNSVFVSLGILLTSLLGMWMSWQVMAGVFAVLIAVSAAGIWFLPESPHWLLNMAPDRQEEARSKLARSALHWFNRSPQQFERSWERLLECSGGAGEVGSGEDQQLLDRRVRAMRTFLRASTFKPLLIVSVVFIAQQFSGTYAIIFYAVPVFQEVGGKIGTAVDEFGAMVIMSGVRMASSLVTVFLSQRFGRRPLMVTSGVGMCVCAFLAGILLGTSRDPNPSLPTATTNATQDVSLFESGVEHPDSWPALVLILLFVVLSAVGFLVIPWTLISELLPLESRGTGGGIMVCLAYVLMFGVVKSFPYVMVTVGAQNTFFIFSSVSLCGAVFVYFFLPETLGKTFKEIERHFVRRSTDYEADA